MGDTPTIQLPAMHAGQRRILDAAGRINVVMCGRRFGKTTMCEHLACMASLNALRVGWFCPTYKLMSMTWRNIIRLLRPVISRINAKEHQVLLTTGGEIEFWTVDNPDAGRSRDYHLCVLDEAGLMRHLQQVMYQSVLPTLSKDEGALWLPGTPKGTGEFYRLYQLGKSGTDPEMRSFNASMADNPCIRPKEIERLRRIMPEDIFNQEVNGIPIEGSTNPFGIDAIRRGIRPLSDLPPVVFGVDLAQRVDWTVIVGLDVNGQVCHFTRFQHRPWPETMQTVANIVGEVPAKVDATGVGVPIVDDLRRRVGNIIPFTFTRPSKQQLMGGLAMRIQAGEVSYPAGPIVDELESFEVAYAAGGASYSAPDGLNDDCVCALALAASELGKAFVGNDILSIV